MMNILRYRLLIILVVFNCFGVWANTISISGSVSNYSADQISVFEVEDGELILVEIQKLKADSTFQFQLPERANGFYYLGKSESFKSVFGSLYMKANQQAKLRIVENGIDESSIPNQEALDYQKAWKARKNEVLSSGWMQAREIEHVEAVVVNFHKAVQDYSANLKSDDATFNQLMKLTAQADFEMFWLRTFSMVNAEVGEVLKKNAIIQEIFNEKNSSAAMLRVKDGSMLIGMYPNFKAQWQGVKIPDYMNFCINTYENDTLKGQFLKEHIINRKVSGKSYANTIAKYGEFLVSDRQKREIAAYEKKIMKFAEGQPAHDFKYEDAKGTMHALSDYKGKVVLVDVWATWCAPCKGEIPHLEKLIEHFHDNEDMVFISVSIDNLKDKDKWENFVKEHELKGIQLLADKAFKSQILLDYEITGVPRFMLFDKEGKIVSVNAARPSNPQLKEMIEEQLN